MSPSLSDVHVLQLSQRLTNPGDLKTLAYQGLKLESHEIESAISNKPNDIQSAAHEILKIWQKQQSNEKKAYSKLVAALTECKMHMLVSQLKQWTEEKSDQTKMSPERT